MTGGTALSRIDGFKCHAIKAKRRKGIQLKVSANNPGSRFSPDSLNTRSIIMKVQVIIERGIDGSFDANMELVGKVPFGLLGQGRTVSETIADFHNSYAEIQNIYDREGKECPDLEFEFKYDVPSFLQYYAYAFTLAGLERITGVNQKQLGHYINGVRKPSKKTIRKIEDHIHSFGAEISAVNFV